MSSTFMILLTVSAASLMAEVDTRRGCTTFSSSMSVMVPWEYIKTTLREKVYIQ